MIKSHKVAVKPKYILTADGLRKLKQEVEQLSEERVTVLAQLSEARDMGDRSENAYYKTTRAKLSSIDRRLHYLRHVLDYVVVAERTSFGVAELGAQITIEIADKQSKYILVSPQEVDFAQGRISLMSPLGRALQGRRVGERFKYRAPAGEIEGKIVAIT